MQFLRFPLCSAFLICAFSKDVRKKLLVDRYEIVYYNPKYLIVNTTFHTLRREKLSYTIDLEVVKNVDFIQAKMMMYKFADGVYKPTSFSFDGNVCALLKTIIYAFRVDETSFLKSFPTCPFKKGKYHLNYNVNEDMDMSYFPAWKCKFNTQFFNNEVKVFESNMYFEIVYNA